MSTKAHSREADLDKQESFHYTMEKKSTQVNRPGC